MIKFSSINAIAKQLSFFFFCFSFQLSYCQTATDAVDALVKAGFENVSSKEDSVERIYVIQNSTYRLEEAGIGAAVDIIREMGLPYINPFLMN